MLRRSLLGAVGAGLTSLLARRACAGAQPPAPRPEAIRPRMRDGAVLGADLWRPQAPGPSPTVLVLTLDRRRDADPAAWPALSDLRAAGHALVAADLRGRWDSEGVHDPADVAQQGRDGYDLVAWIAAQAWCDGRVGLLGLGRAAGAAVASALEAPPPLGALAVWGGGFEAAPDGAVRLLDALGAAAEDAASDLARMTVAGQDASAARAALETLTARPRDVYEHLPLLQSPALRAAPLQARARAALARAAAPATDPPWARLSLPVFHVCGWYDPAAGDQVAAFEALRRRAGPAGAGQHLTLGPWASGPTFGRRLGDVTFGAEADGAGLGLRQAAFFDAALRGRPAALAPVRYFMMGVNAWRESPEWPPPGAARQRLYLRSGGGANSAAGDGALDVEPPGGDPPDRFVYDPLAPTPSVGGALASRLWRAGHAGPMAQSRVERRYDVLCYTTPPFESGVELCGPVTLRIHVSTSAPDADFVAKLTHVYPDGAAVNLCEAAARLSRRHAVEPGEVYEVAFAVGQTATAIPRGGRLRLQIASASFPLFDRGLNLAGTADPGRTGPPATQMVHHRRGLVSHIEVTLAPARGAA